MKKLNKEDGFTLIEVLIALTIFAVGLLAVAAMQNSAILMNSNAGKLTHLSTWGMDKMEELSSLPYFDADLDPDGNPHSSPPVEGYSVAWTITESFTLIDGNLESSSKNITITVAGKGKSINISFIKPNV